jgi:hypothetical protein
VRTPDPTTLKCPSRETEENLSSKPFTMRTNPNIIITGTPGVGKTSHSTLLASTTGLKHLSINQVVKERGCHEGWSDEYQSWIVDEDKVCDFEAILLNDTNFILFTDFLLFFPFWIG